MTCSSIDLKAYVLGEADLRDRSPVEEHLHACASCREELDSLELTRTALSSLPDEEMPRRIAFVSDAVFEPRWWRRIWTSGPAMGFASALVLAAAIFVHAATRPAPVVTSALGSAALSGQQVDERVDAAVAKAVASAVATVEKRQAEQTAQLLNATEKRFEDKRRVDMITAQETIRMYQQQAGRMMVAYNSSQGGSRQ